MYSKMLKTTSLNLIEHKLLGSYSAVYIGNRSQNKTFTICLLSLCLWENICNFIDLVIQLYIIFWKEIQEYVHECTNIREVHKYFLLQMIPDICHIAKGMLLMMPNIHWYMYRLIPLIIYKWVNICVARSVESHSTKCYCKCKLSCYCILSLCLWLAI